MQDQGEKESKMIPEFGACLDNAIKSSGLDLLNLRQLSD